MKIGGKNVSNTLYIGGQRPFTSADKSNLDKNTSARHEHANKNVLDGITAEKVSQWNAGGGGSGGGGTVDVSGKEDTSNKVTAITGNETAEKYPTALAVIDYLNKNGGSGGVLTSVPTEYTVGEVGRVYAYVDYTENENGIAKQLYACTQKYEIPGQRTTYLWVEIPYAPPIMTEIGLLMENVDELKSKVDTISPDGGIPRIEGTDMAEKCAEFSLLMKDTELAESFIFYTDPHLLQFSGYDEQFHYYMNTLRNYYYSTPTSFIICGGDWLGDDDTYEQACFKLGYIDGLTRYHFDKHYQVIGNHDTNQYGINNEGIVNSGVLTQNTVCNLFNRENDNTYYSFSGNNTRFYVLDSWTETSSVTNYRWTQIDWLATQLKQNDDTNSAIVLHIGYTGGASSGVCSVYPFSENITALCNAYNERSQITLNGVNYNFTTCNGGVRFMLSGHTHMDYVSVVNNIPVIATTHMRAGGTPTFDLCLVDYNANKLHLVRVGTGNSRDVDLAVINSDSYVHTCKGDIVCLAQVNHDGTNLESVTTRCCIVSSVDTGSSLSAKTQDLEGYYTMKIPNGALSVTVTCPGWYIVGINEIGSDGKRKCGSTEADDELTYTFSGNNQWFIIKLEPSDKSVVSPDFDGSGISWTFTYSG